MGTLRFSSKAFFFIFITPILFTDGFNIKIQDLPMIRTNAIWYGFGSTLILFYLCVVFNTFLFDIYHENGQQFHMFVNNWTVFVLSACLIATKSILALSVIHHGKGAKHMFPIAFGEGTFAL
jgi:NhaP-type Na+/H+ or K+/H+ antiporter